jgi:hypothetical protein
MAPNRPRNTQTAKHICGAKTMSDLPKKYYRMTKDKLNILAIGGDANAQKALAIHESLDRLTAKVFYMQERLDRI